MSLEITVTLNEDLAELAHRKAAEQNISVSELVGRLLEAEFKKETRLSEEYWRAYERWKKMEPIPGIDAEPKLTREELHERR